MTYSPMAMAAVEVAVVLAALPVVDRVKVPSLVEPHERVLGVVHGEGLPVVVDRLVAAVPLGGGGDPRMLRAAAGAAGEQRGPARNATGDQAAGATITRGSMAA